MLENILLSAVYFESFSKFSSSLSSNDKFTKEEINTIAENTLEEFFISADSTGATPDDINALGEGYYTHVLAELNEKHQDDDADVSYADTDIKELEADIFNSLIKEINLK